MNFIIDRNLQIKLITYVNKLQLIVKCNCFFTFLSILGISVFIVYLISKLPYGNYIVSVPKKREKSNYVKPHIRTMESNLDRS